MTALANRRLQPLGHLTADFQVYETETVTRKAFHIDAVMTVRVQTRAFDAKCNYKNGFLSSACYSFWAHRLGTVLGTLGAFFARFVEKSARKREKATVFLTVAFLRMRAARTRDCLMHPGEVAERRQTNVVALVSGEDR